MARDWVVRSKENSKEHWKNLHKNVSVSHPTPHGLRCRPCWRPSCDHWMAGRLLWCHAAGTGRRQPSRAGESCSHDVPLEAPGHGATCGAAEGCWLLCRALAQPRPLQDAAERTPGPGSDTPASCNVSPAPSTDTAATPPGNFLKGLGLLFSWSAQKEWIRGREELGQ